MTSLPELLGPNAANPGETTGYWQTVKQWSMGGNDERGSCAFAAPCNYIDLVTTLNGNPQVVTEAEALRFYSVAAGFDPGKPETDRGSTIETMLTYWMEHGWPADPTYKPVGWCKIEEDQIPAAIYGLGAVLAWCVLPPEEDGENPFSDAMWDREPTRPHAVLIVGSEPNGLVVVSWAQVWRASWEWWDRFGRDCYAVRLPDWQVMRA